MMDLKYEAEDISTINIDNLSINIRFLNNYDEITEPIFFDYL